MKALLVTLIGLVLPAAVLADEAKMAAADSSIVIGMSTLSLEHPFHAALKNAAEQTAAQLGVRIVVADARVDAGQQERDLRNLVAQRVQGILLVPMIWAAPGSSTIWILPAIEAAAKAGVPVATVDQRVNTDKVLVHVGADNWEGGRAAAKFIIDKLGNKGAVIELEGYPSPAAQDRKAGFHEVIKKSNVKILDSQVANWDRGQGRNAMESAIRKFPGAFGAVFAANDEMIVGAIDAMSAAHVDLSKMVTVGFDATPVAFQYMRDGKLSATIDQFPDKQAGQALRYLVDYIRNKTKPPKQVFLIEPKLITPELVTMAP